MRPRRSLTRPATQSAATLESSARPTLVPAMPAWCESSAVATAPTLALSGMAALVAA